MENTTLIAVSIIVFFAGFGVASVVYYNPSNPPLLGHGMNDMMANSETMNQMMSQNPKMSQMWMDSDMMNAMMNDPEMQKMIMTNMHDSNQMQMMEDMMKDMMNRMQNDPELKQAMMEHMDRMRASRDAMMGNMMGMNHGMMATMNNTGMMATAMNDPEL